MAVNRSKKADSWDNEENEAKSLTFKFKKPMDNDYEGDRIHGVLMSKRQVPNRLSTTPGAKQWLYEVKVKKVCEYHDADKKGNPIEPSITVPEGTVINVYGTNFFDGRMRQVQAGQVFGLKYVGDLPSKEKGKADTKNIKVYIFRDDNSPTGYEMDDEVVNQLNVDNFDNE